MSFNPGSGGIASATDVALSNPATNDLLTYNSGVAKWQNAGLTGQGALAYNGGVETVSTVSAATGSVSLNLSNGNVFNVTLTGNTTFTFTGATAGKACSFALYLAQNSVGNKTVTWGSTVKWSGGAPALTTTANAIDVLVFETINGGTTWFGYLAGTNFS